MLRRDLFPVEHFPERHFYARAVESHIARRGRGRRSTKDALGSKPRFFLSSAQFVNSIEIKPIYLVLSNGFSHMRIAVMSKQGMFKVTQAGKTKTNQSL